MDWSVLLDRAVFLLVGCVVGFILGYAVRAAKDAQAEAHAALSKVAGLTEELHPTSKEQDEPEE